MRSSLVLAPLLGLTLAACGSTGSPSSWAAPQTIRIDERSSCDGLAVRVGAVRIGRSGWAVTASIDNAGATTLDVTRPHVAGGTFFGLARPGVRHPGLLARRFTPPLPRTIAPGVRWSGSFSAPGHVGRGPLQVVLGRFTPAGRVIGFLCVTDRTVRVR